LSADSTNRPAEAVPAPGANVLHDIALTFVDPTRVFFNLPRVNRSTTALVIMLAVQALLGWMLVATGVYAYEVKRAAARAAMAHIKAHEGDDDPNVAIEAADAIEKGSEFQVTVYRLTALAGRPLWTLCVVGLVGGFLFVAVALSGGKPKMPLLTGIVIFASLVQIPHAAVKLYLTGVTKHTRVETSAAAFPKELGPNGASLSEYIMLRRLNPFDVWFWALVWLGARKAARMTVRGSTITVGLMVLCDVVFQSGLDYAELANMPPPAQEG
jgi:hypothetical protein